MIPREVFAETIVGFLEPVRPYLEDGSVSEIMINGPREIYVERRGRIEKVPAQFSSLDALEAAVRNIAQFVGRHVDRQRPILEARLPDGSRVEAILPPASPYGPSIAIRRFQKHTMTIDRLVELGSLTPDATQTLRAVVACKQNVIVAGGTGSGKTSLLNVLSSFIAEDERIVVIEDAQELQLQKPHVVGLEAQPPDASGRGAVSIRDLFRATLRMRPDRIVVGEIRGGEALDLVQAMTSGHGGALSTVHATYPADTMTRLETMAMMSDVELPLHALRVQIASAIDFIVQVSRLRDGSRCVTHVSEVVSGGPDGYVIQDVFLRSYRGETSEGKVVSELLPTGNFPKCAEVVHAHGLRFAQSVYDRAGVAPP